MNKKLVYIIPILFFFGHCVDDSNVASKTEYLEVNRTVFVGMKEENTYAEIAQLLEKDLNLALQQKKIDSSDSENELRIYFASPLGESYFKLETNYNNQQKVELVDLSYDKSNDSLFVKVNSKIIWKEKRHYFGYDFKTREKMIIDSSWGVDMSNVTEGGFVYYIEIKKGANVRKLISNNPFVKADSSYVSRKVTDIIKTVEKSYGFKFYEGIHKLKDSIKFSPTPIN